MDVPSGLDPRRAAAGAGIAAAALILSVQLLLPPVIGLANNADFEKVMGYAGLQYLTEGYQDRYFSWILTKFAIVRAGWYHSGYYTSETLLVVGARLVARLFTREGLFDIRILGALHIALFLVAIGGIVGSCRGLAAGTSWLVAFLLVFFFTDVGYAAPFNSLYSQTASFLFLMLTAATVAGAIQRGRLEGWLLPAYVACAVLFIGSKPQESTQGPLLALFGFRLACLPQSRGRRAFPTGIALAIGGFSILYGLEAPRSLREAALYQVVFYEILPHAPNPESDVEELGLDARWTTYAGTTAWQKNSPFNDSTLRAEFLRRASYGRVLELYARHPGRLAAVVRRGAAQAWSLRPEGYGNFEKKEGLPPRQTTPAFATWSNIRQHLNRDPLFWLGLLFAANLLAVAATYRRASRKGRLFREGIALLVFMAIVEFLVCTLVNAHTDLVRTLYAFEAMCDVLLIVDAAWLLEVAHRPARSTAVPMSA